MKFNKYSFSFASFQKLKKFQKNSLNKLKVMLHYDLMLYCQVKSFQRRWLSFWVAFNFTYKSNTLSFEAFNVLERSHDQNWLLLAIIAVIRSGWLVKSFKWSERLWVNISSFVNVGHSLDKKLARCFTFASHVLSLHFINTNINWLGNLNVQCSNASRQIVVHVASLNNNKN
ncbi:hypothetical protein BpHYR1_020079 [Brachionus plicatilis]|uniref:Uncharacterized protein n=1 Tax=Brachionus plicatilis TaxID=10195 RepID=A0A3M7REY4_BRAPC|nr:hypothetical protein BpHYR1_020079 [Brachionus plicatilis]